MKLEKQKSHAFGKDVYLLGTINGKYQWLVAPSWDCEWYWGFGYVQEFTNHKCPSISKDTNSHTHIDSLTESVFHRITDGVFEETTFDQREAWDLSELFKQFYLLKDMAGFTLNERPNCHITQSPVDHGSLKDWHTHINEVMIPKVTARILEILSPSEEA